MRSCFALNSFHRIKVLSFLRSIIYSLLGIGIINNFISRNKSIVYVKTLFLMALLIRYNYYIVTIFLIGLMFPLPMINSDNVGFDSCCIISPLNQSVLYLSYLSGCCLEFQLIISLYFWPYLSFHFGICYLNRLSFLVSSWRWQP